MYHFEGIYADVKWTNMNGKCSQILNPVISYTEGIYYIMVEKLRSKPIVILSIITTLRVKFFEKVIEVQDTSY